MVFIERQERDSSGRGGCIGTGNLGKCPQNSKLESDGGWGGGGGWEGGLRTFILPPCHFFRSRATKNDSEKGYHVM